MFLPNGLNGWQVLQKHLEDLLNSPYCPGPPFQTQRIQKTAFNVFVKYFI